MNKRCTISLLIGFFALLFPELTIAQNSERMLIFTKSGKVFPYRTEYIDSIKFLTGAVDLSLNPQIVPHPNGTTGAMKLSIGSVGEDVARIQVVLPETFQVEKMTDYQCLKFFEPTSTAQTGMQIYEVKGNNEYDLTGMQRGYDYTALFLPYDKMGCAGNVKRLNFTVPLGKLEGNPSIAVSFSDVTTEGFKVKFEPNSDVKGYFYLCDETESSDREQMMKMFGIPDLKHYVVSFGADFATRKAHVGEKEHVFNDFKPGTQYSVFVVLVDAKGQYSDLYKNFTVTTVKKGTSEEATLSIEVSNITESSATVTTTPDKNTSIYRESVILKGAMTDEEMIAYLRDTPESLQLPFRSEAYTQTWENLDVGAAYYAVGLAKNGDGKWGPLAKKEFTLKNKETRVKLPLEYVAEYNINPQGTGFVSTHATSVSGYFTFDDAVTKFSNIEIDGKKYHLPSKEEWLAIVPESSAKDYVSFISSDVFNDVSETVSIAGNMVTSTNDYRGNIGGVAYALRYKGTDFVSAWRYEYIKVDGQQVLKITARSVKENIPAISIGDIIKPSFWQSNTSNDVVRIFPAAGFIDSTDESYGLGKDGFLWSSSSYNMWYSWSVLFGVSYSVVDYSTLSNRYSVRLFL